MQQASCTSTQRWLPRLQTTTGPWPSRALKSMASHLLIRSLACMRIHIMILSFCIYSILHTSMNWRLTCYVLQSLFLQPRILQERRSADQGCNKAQRHSCSYCTGLHKLGKHTHASNNIQGRYDMVCPMKSAYDLVKVYTEAELIVVPDAGHSAKEV